MDYVDWMLFFLFFTVTLLVFPTLCPWSCIIKTRILKLHPKNTHFFREKPEVILFRAPGFFVIMYPSSLPSVAVPIKDYPDGLRKTNNLWSKFLWKSSEFFSQIRMNIPTR